MFSSLLGSQPGRCRSLTSLQLAAKLLPNTTAGDQVRELLVSALFGAVLMTLFMLNSGRLAKEPGSLTSLSSIGGEAAAKHFGWVE